MNQLDIRLRTASTHTDVRATRRFRDVVLFCKALNSIRTVVVLLAMAWSVRDLHTLIRKSHKTSDALYKQCIHTIVVHGER